MGSNSSSAQSNTSVVSWLAQPFNTDQDALHWVFFLGFVLIVAIFWRFVLRQIIEAV
jgi:hypothetical protein